MALRLSAYQNPMHLTPLLRTAGPRANGQGGTSGAYPRQDGMERLRAAKPGT